jgi:hypothetical protein
MRQGTAILVLVGAAALLAGCVYDPYTGAMVPCCNYYGYPYYRYPAPYSPYGYPSPYGAPQAAQPGTYQGQPGTDQGPPGGYQDPSGGYQAPPTGYQGQPGGYQAPPGQGAPGQGPPPGPTSLLAPGGGLAQRFAAANVTHDGRLTRQQAQAGMPRIAENFDAIDIDRKGFVTLPEIRTFISRQQAAGGQSGQFEQNQD